MVVLARDKVCGCGVRVVVEAVVGGTAVGVENCLDGEACGRQWIGACRLFTYGVVMASASVAHPYRFSLFGPLSVRVWRDISCVGGLTWWS